MFEHITLEMSLKPFRRLEQGYIESVCETFFKQWYPLIKNAQTVRVLLWVADGSELLEYTGDLAEEIEWGRYIGGAHQIKPWDPEKDPDRLSPHTRSYLYIENPPVITFGDLKRIVEAIKRVGHAVLGADKTIWVGETFDPGPEFAVSDFKYHRHNEICADTSVGKGKTVCCYGRLHADSRSYAGFPDGIPEGTAMGTFLGKQTTAFCADLGFDYLWLSNGFGFGTDTWGTTGAIYDGKEFHADRIDAVRDNILDFWRLFREVCPHIPIETRGTNLSTGIDRSTDGVPLGEIYSGGFDMLPPPNSPWAALDGDFGLELVGYMSRIASVPAGQYLFRYYTHDPWWVNSPWIDRYEGQPHDIYLPLAVSRVGEDGQVHTPTHLNFLTVDNSFGEMPDRVPNEVIPHICAAQEHRPDAPSPVVLIYPFDEYTTLKDEQSLKEMFFSDWYLRGALNHTMPMSTVVSTAAFVKTSREHPALYGGSVLVSAIPQAGSEWEQALLDTVERGGKVLLFGSVDRASERLRRLLNLNTAKAVAGELPIAFDNRLDQFAEGGYSGLLNHRELMCAGGIDTVLAREDECSRVLASVGTGGERRVIALERSLPEYGTKLVWLRGTNSSRYVGSERFEEAALLLRPDDPKQYFAGEILMRHALRCFGITVGTAMDNPSAKPPVLMLHRSNNAFYFSGYMPDTTTEISLGMPPGAPLLMGYETRLKDGCSAWRMPRAFHCEARAFVEGQEGGVLSCHEIPPVSFQMRRRFQITGLRHATVRIFPEADCVGTMAVLLNSEHPHFVGDDFEGEWKTGEYGPYFEAKDVTGRLTVSMPRKLD